MRQTMRYIMTLTALLMISVGAWAANTVKQGTVANATVTFSTDNSAYSGLLNNVGSGTTVYMKVVVKDGYYIETGDIKLTQTIGSDQAQTRTEPAASNVTYALQTGTATDLTGEHIYTFEMPASGADVRVDATGHERTNIASYVVDVPAVTYTGAAQTSGAPTVKANSTAAALTVTTDYTVDNVTETDANETGYDVVVTGVNKYIGSATGKFKINKAALTITAKSQTITYGNTIAQGTDQVNVTGLIAGDALTGISLTPSTTDVTTAGTITPSSASTTNGISNYSVTYNTGVLTINGAAIEATATGYTGTYDAQAHTITVNVLAPATGATIKYGTSSDACTQDALSYTDAGTYTIYYKVTAPNYLDKTGSATVTINKAALATLTLQKDASGSAGLTYNGSVQSPTIVSVTSENGLTVPASDYTPGAGATDQGHGYTYTVTAKDGSNFTGSASALYDIEPANLTDANRFVVTATGVGGLTYTGAEQTATAITVVRKSDNYALSSGTDYDVAYSNNVKAGTATITVTGKGNYWGSPVTTFTIAKAPLTVTANAHSITYGDVPANNGVEYSGFVNSETQTALEGELGYTYSYSQYGNAGSYAITPGGLTAQNYAITFANGTLTVGKKEVGVNWTDLEFTYNGSEQKPTATATGLVNGDAVSVTVSGGQTNAGTGFTATASGLTGAKAGNYQLPEPAPTATFSIAKAEISGITVTPYNAAYDGEAHGIKVTADGATVTYSETADGAYTATEIKKTNTGIYTVYYKVEKANSNDVKGSSTITITKANIPSVAVTDITAPVLGDFLDTGAICQTEGVTTTAPTITWLIGSAEATDIVRGNAAYTAVVMLEADSNHQFTGSTTGTLGGQNATASVDGNGRLKLSYTYPTTDMATPTAAMFNVTLPADLVYDGSQKVALVSYAAGYEGAGLGTATVKYYSGSTELPSAPTEVGTYTVKLDVAMGSVYSASTALTKSDWTFTITNAGISVAATGYSGIYDAQPHHITLNVLAPAAGATVTYSETENGTYTAAAIEKTNAGTYTVYYKVEAPNYTTAMGSSTIEISPAPLTAVTLVNTNLTYNGSLQTPTIEQVEAQGDLTGLVLNTDYTVGAGQTNTGDYSLAVTGTGNYTGTVYGAYSIVAAEANTSFTVELGVPSEGYTYDGTAKTPTVTVKDGETTLTHNTDYTYEYKNNTGANRSEHQNHVVVTGKGNYAGTKVAYFEIGKKQLTVKASDCTITYGNAPANSGVTYSGWTGDAEPITGNVIYTYDYEIYANAGSYHIIPDVSELYANNYSFMSDNGTLTVNKKEVGVTWTDLVQVYSGSPLKPTATVTGAVNGDVVTATLSEAPTDAGEHTMTVTGLAGANAGNYTLPSTAPSTNFTINKAASRPLEGTVEAKVENGSITVTGPSAPSGYTLEYSLDNTNWQDSNVFGSETPLTPNTTYTVYIRKKASANEEASKPISAVFKTTNFVTPTVTISDITAGETPTVTVAVGTTTLTAGTDYTVTYKNSTGETVTDFSTPGTYTVVIAPVEGSEYSFATQEKTFTVAAAVKDITESIAIEVGNITAGETPTVTVKDGSTALTAGTDYTVTYKNSAGETVTDFSTPGTYTAVIAPVDGSAYTFTTQEKTFTVAEVPANDPQKGDQVKIKDSDSGSEMTGTVTGSRTDESTGKTVYEVTLNSLPASVLNGTSSLRGDDMTFEKDGFTYQVTKVDTKAFDGQAEGAIIYLPTGVYTTGAVTNVVNGDGTATELNLNKVTSFNAPREIKADKVTYQRTESEAYFTLCLPYGFELPDGYTSWTLERGVNGVAEFSHSRKSLQAYEPYVIEATTKTGTRGSKDVLDLSATNVTIAATGSDKSVLKDDVEMFGTVKGLTLYMGYDLEAYVMEEDANWRMKPLTSSLYVPAFECYLVVKWGRDIFPSQFGKATGIWGIEGDASDADGWYDLSGRKLDGKPTGKGVYIHHGIKIVVK